MAIGLDGWGWVGRCLVAVVKSVDSNLMHNAQSAHKFIRFPRKTRQIPGEENLGSLEKGMMVEVA